MFPRIGNAFVGIAYDMAHYDELPTNDKFDYIVIREERWKYVLITGLFLLFIVFLIAAVAMTCMNTSTIRVNDKVVDLSQFGDLDGMQLVLRRAK